jgi:hypothetical protein
MEAATGDAGARNIVKQVAVAASAHVGLGVKEPAEVSKVTVPVGMAPLPSTDAVHSTGVPSNTELALQETEVILVLPVSYTYWKAMVCAEVMVPVTAWEVLHP